MVTILTLKETEKVGTNKRAVDFKEFAYEMMRFTRQFSLEGLRILFNYLNHNPFTEEETVTHYGYWSLHYKECNFEEFVETVKFRILCDKCKPTKKSIQEAFSYNQINDDYCYLVGLTDTSVIYANFN